MNELTYEAGRSGSHRSVWCRARRRSARRNRDCARAVRSARENSAGPSHRRRLGVPREEVLSPTFVLCHEYHGTRTIYHLDAYRLHDEDELRELGIEELFATEAIVIVEWADRVTGALPDDYLQIEIAVTGTTSRRITVAPLATKIGKSLRPSPLSKPSRLGGLFQCLPAFPERSAASAKSLIVHHQVNKVVGQDFVGVNDVVRVLADFFQGTPALFSDRRQLVGRS